VQQKYKVNVEGEVFLSIERRSVIYGNVSAHRKSSCPAALIENSKKG